MSDNSIKILKKIWWFLLLIIFGWHIIHNYSRVSANPNIVDSIVLISLFVVMFMPLIYEINAFGLSIKKELENTKKDISGEVTSLRTDLLSVVLSNNNSNNVYVGSDRLPTKQELRSESTGKVHKDNNSTKRANLTVVKNPLYENYGPSDNQKFLFETRFVLEQKVKNIMNDNDLDAHSSLRRNVSELKRNEIISSEIEDKVLKIIAICNRGIDGEVIDNEYVQYAGKTMNEVGKKI